MSSYGKFLLGVLLLFVAGKAVPAQSGLDNSQAISAAGSYGCNDITLTVIDAAGMAIMGATVTIEDRGIPLTTDSRGLVDIPCRSIVGRWPVLAVSAQGYRSTQVTLMPDARSRLEVRLDRRESATRPAGATIRASELLPNVQKESVLLQEEAKRALAVSDYDGAERLLMQALQLTPSAATIANNLGVVALRRRDVDTAASWFEKASEAAPLKADILGNLGLARWLQRRTEESYAILTKAFSRGYESNLGNYILGMMGLEKGKSKEAADRLKKIPADHFPYRDLYLSIALRNCGKSKAADAVYRNFLRHHPTPFLISVLR